MGLAFIPLGTNRPFSAVHTEMVAPGQVHSKKLLQMPRAVRGPGHRPDRVTGVVLVRPDDPLGHPDDPLGHLAASLGDPVSSASS